MKAFYIPAGLLAVILGFSLWTGRYVEERTDQWTARLEAVDRAAGEEDWAGAEELLDRAYGDWERSQTFFHTIMAHEELDEAETLFAGAFAVCREQDSADFRLLLAQLTSQLRLLAQTQSLSVRNVL